MTLQTDNTHNHRITAYFDLLAGINQQFGAAMALNRSIKKVMSMPLNTVVSETTVSESVLAEKVASETVVRETSAVSLQPGSYKQKAA